MQLAEATERNDAGKCFDIAAQMKAQGVEPNLHTYNMLMFAASIDFRGLDAWAIFDDLILYGFEPNVAIFNTMLNVALLFPPVNHCITDALLLGTSTKVVGVYVGGYGEDAGTWCRPQCSYIRSPHPNLHQ